MFQFPSNCGPHLHLTISSSSSSSISLPLQRFLITSPRWLFVAANSHKSTNYQPLWFLSYERVVKEWISSLPSFPSTVFFFLGWLMRQRPRDRLIRTLLFIRFIHSLPNKIFLWSPNITIHKKIWTCFTLVGLVSSHLSFTKKIKTCFQPNRSLLPLMPP